MIILRGCIFLHYFMVIEHNYFIVYNLLVVFLLVFYFTGI